MTSPSNRVLIVGAGLGGLTLAQSLRKLNIPHLVLERDASASSRAQGWSIGVSWIIEPLLAGIITSDKPDLRSTCANYAVGHEECIAFQSSCFMDGTTGRMVQKDMTKFEEVQELRVSRRKLRDWLAIGVDIEWGKSVSGVTENEEGVVVQCSDGTVFKGAILVGADGVTSQVRQYLFPDCKTKCLPVTVISAQRRLSYDQYAEITSTLAPAASVAYADRILLALTLIELHSPAKSSGPGADFFWFLSSIDQSEQALQEAGQSDGIEWMERQAAKSSSDRYSEVLKIVKDTGIVEPLKSVVEQTSSEEPVTQIFMREVTIDSFPEGRVTLLGDAAHAMSIFHGVAGNHAMLDALKLGPILASLLSPSKAGVSTKEVSAALKVYADEMLPRNLQEQTAARKSTFAMHRSLAEWQGLSGLSAAHDKAERKVWGNEDSK